MTRDMLREAIDAAHDRVFARAIIDEQIVGQRQRAQAAAHKAWVSRRAGRTKERPARARVLVVDGPFAGKRLLLDRATVQSGAWEIPGATYRFCDAFGERIAYVAHESDALPVLAWRGWGISVERTMTDETERDMLRAVVHGLTKAEAERAIATQLRYTLESRGSWPGTGPLAAECSERRVPIAQSTSAPIVFGVQAHPDAVEYEILPAHPAPQLDCSCGIYACATWYALHAAGYADLYAVGLIAGWGKVIEHETGYRFARAYPVVIVVNGTIDRRVGDGLITIGEIVRGLRTTYRVPVAAANPLGLHEKVEELVARADSPLPAWAYDALPPDLRAAGHRHKKAKEDR